MSDAEDEKKNLPFHEMELDERILKAIAKLGWIDPTLIQVIYFYLSILSQGCIILRMILDEWGGVIGHQKASFFILFFPIKSFIFPNVSKTEILQIDSVFKFK